MLVIHPLKEKDIPLLLRETKICSTIFFDRLQQLKDQHGCHISFEFMQVTGSTYCFDEQGNISKESKGCKVRFDYRLGAIPDKKAPLHFVLF